MKEVDAVVASADVLVAGISACDAGRAGVVTNMGSGGVSHG